MTTVRTFRDSRRLIQAGAPIDVIIRDLTLPDGNRSDVMRHMIESGSNASVVIRTPSADERLWSEAL